MSVENETQHGDWTMLTFTLKLLVSVVLVACCFFCPLLAFVNIQTINTLWNDE